MCEEFETEVVIVNKSHVREASPIGEETTFEQELVQDMIELITVFSARLSGSKLRAIRALPVI